MEMSWLQSIKDLKYLLFLLVPVGIYLMVIGIKKVSGFAKAKMIYEMPVSLIDGSFRLGMAVNMIYGFVEKSIQYLLCII